jgi:branched-chain amino acid transport system permease protein
VAAAVTIVVALPLVLPSASLATEVLVFAIAAMGCNLLLGYTGLLSFGQGIFFGLGAYLASLALLHTGAGLLTSVLFALVAGGATAAVVGALAIRRRGVYFVMLTLAFAQVAYFIAYTAKRITGGENGLLDVPRPPLAFFGVQLSSLGSSLSYYAFVAAIFLAVLFGLQRVIRSPFGATLVGIRDNEERAIAIGYDTRGLKILAFVISGAITAVAGALYAVSLQFSPISNIEFAMSEQILIMTIIGGTGSFFGSVLGAAFLVVVGELLSAVWPRWMLLLGMLLIGIVIFMRGGLWGGIEAIVQHLRGRRAVRLSPLAEEVADE